MTSSSDSSFSSLHDHLEGLRKNFDTALDALFADLAQAREAVSELQGAGDEHAGKLQQAEERIAAQDELIETLNQELKDAKSARNDLRARELEIERMRSELATKNDLVKAVRDQVAKANEHSASLQKQLDEAAEQTADATAMDNAEIISLKAELEARRTMIKSLRDDVARAESLEQQLDAKRETISMLEESIEQNVQTIEDLRKSADAWRAKYMASKGGPAPDIDDTLTEHPDFTDTEIDAIRKLEQSGDPSDKTVAINMRAVLDRVRSRKGPRPAKPVKAGNENAAESQGS
jgi:chromosome segregation ATPase